MANITSTYSSWQELTMCPCPTAKELVVFCLPGKKGELDEVNIGDAYPFSSHQILPHEEGLGWGPGILGCADSEQPYTSGWLLVGLPIFPPTHCTYMQAFHGRGGMRADRPASSALFLCMWSVPTSGASSRGSQKTVCCHLINQFVKATKTISSTFVSGNNCFFVCFFTIAFCRKAAE